MGVEYFSTFKECFSLQKGKYRSNSFDDANHNDNEMVEIITMCYILGCAYNSISE